MFAEHSFALKIILSILFRDTVGHTSSSTELAPPEKSYTARVKSLEKRADWHPLIRWGKSRRSIITGFKGVTVID